MKRIISALLSVILVLSLFPASVFAADIILNVTEGDYTYVVWNGEAKITNCDESITGSIVVPDTLGGYPVTKIDAYAFQSCSDLTSVKIPEGITTLGDQAFSWCENLKYVELPQSLEIIEKTAFYYCTALQEIVIPDGVREIGSGAFYNCRDLTYVNIPNGITVINSFTFQYCESLTSIVIPESVTSIGSSAFEDCENLTDVQLSNGLKSIGDSAFWCCENLTSIELPNSLEIIGDYAFAATKLSDIKLPDSVISIGEEAFSDCRRLNSITIPRSVSEIGRYAFDKDTIKILCYKNSAAHIYAQRYNFKFELLPDLYLQPNKIKIYAGDSKQLDALLTGFTGKVTWSSSNSEIVSVDSSGNIYAHSGGRAIITAKSGEYFATCEVTVPCTVKYIVNGVQVWAAVPPSQIKTFNQPLQLSDYIPDRPQYEFQGWSTEPNDTTVEYQPGDTYTEDKDVTLYAVWKWKSKCTTCSGRGETRCMCSRCRGDGKADTTKTCTSCDGKGSWQEKYTVKEEHTCPICHGELVIWSDTSQNWVPCRFCGGFGTVTVDVDKTKTVTCSNCNGLGKLTSPNSVTCTSCKGLGYVSTMCSACHGSGGMNQNSFYILCDLNGGVGEPYLHFKSKDTTITLTTRIPERPGYTFCGWTTSIGGPVEYQPGDTYSTNRDLILVAVWQKEPEPIPGYSCGDIDNNGTINLKDVTQLQKYLAGWDVEVVTEYCDINADGEINLKDVTHLQKYLAGWEVELGQS